MPAKSSARGSGNGPTNVFEKPSDMPTSTVLGDTPFTFTVNVVPICGTVPGGAASVPLGPQPVPNVVNDPSMGGGRSKQVCAVIPICVDPPNSTTACLASSYAIAWL